MFNGEHRAKVIVHYVGHVIVGCDNNSFQSFEWIYDVPYYSSLVDIRVTAFVIVFTNSCNAYTLLRFCTLTAKKHEESLNKFLVMLLEECLAL